MASIFGAAAQQELKDQPWYLRYKGSLLIVGSGVAWILGELATSQEIADLGWSSADRRPSLIVHQSPPHW